MREEQADVKALLVFLLRGLFVALPLGVLAALAAFYLSGRLPPTFEATATVLATREANTVTTTATSLSAPPIEASAYSDIALTRPVLEDALARLGQRDLDAEAFDAFRGAVAVSVLGERDALSNLITVSVQAGSARASARRANAVAEALVAWDYERASRNVGQRIDTLEAQIRSLDESIESLRLMGAVASPLEIENRVSLRAEQQEELSYARALLDSAAGLLTVVEPATPPAESVAPRPVFNAALAGVFAVFAVYGLLLLRSALDSRLRDVAAIKEAADLPVLAEFPDTRNAHLLREAADYFQAQLMLVSATPGTRVILVTSAKSGEGKTTVALHLAESLTRHGHRTLLVDADLRQPAIAKRYNVPENQGSLLHHLFDPEQYGPTRLKVAGSTLDLIPSFKPTATPLLGRNLPACLEVWRRSYDVIVLDSAPLLPVADTFTIAPYCTHTVLIGNLRRSDRRSFRTAFERLTLMGVPLVGMVVTRVRERSLHSREYRRYLRAGSGA